MPFHCKEVVGNQDLIERKLLAEVHNLFGIISILKDDPLVVMIEKERDDIALACVFPAKLTPKVQHFHADSKVRLNSKKISLVFHAVSPNVVPVDAHEAVVAGRRDGLRVEARFLVYYGNYIQRIDRKSVV